MTGLSTAPGRRRTSTALLALAATLACAGRASVPATATPCADLQPVFPAETWERVAQPECVGWSSEGLAAVDRELSEMATTGMLAVAGGRVFFEYGDPIAVSYLASVRKSILSMLYGIYVDRGVIDLDETLAQIGIDDVGGLTAVEKQATVRHLISARSGIYHQASNAGDDLASAPPRGSMKPGEYFLYNNWDFNAAGSVFEIKTGMSIYDALEQEIVRPVAMQDFDRNMHRRTGDASRSTHLAYHMHLSTRDMARVGLLMLRNGNWNGRQIVPSTWVRESTTALTPVSEMNPPVRRDGPFGYGYLWWVFDRPELGPEYQGGYTGLGAIGQHILVLPALDLVVAHKTRPGQDESVSHARFLEIVDLIVKAHCGDACPRSRT